MCFYTVRALLKPQQVVEVVPAPCARFVQRTTLPRIYQEKIGDFLLIRKDDAEVREAFAIIVTPELNRLFNRVHTKLHSSSSTWFCSPSSTAQTVFVGIEEYSISPVIANLAALMALIRGRSDAPDPEHLSRPIHATLFSLQTWIYWEWVPSKSNWVEMLSIGWVETIHLSVEMASATFKHFFPLLLWHLPSPAHTRTFEYI